MKLRGSLAPSRYQKRRVKPRVDRLASLIPFPYHERTMPTPDNTDRQNTKKTSEPSKLFTGCCLSLSVFGGAVIGMIVGPIVAFQRGAGDFDFVGIAPGLVVGGFLGFLIGFILVAVLSHNDRQN